MSYSWRLHFLIGLYIIIICVALEVKPQQNCDRVFASYQMDKTKGNFSSPNFPKPYPNGINCKYKFIGRSNQRIKIQFLEFALQGRPPSCINDYVNIYSQLKQESDDLLEAQMSGPFCGDAKDDLPKLVVSSHNVLVIWFYSNQNKSSGGFNGTWEFIDAVQYEMGTVATNTCDYTIRSENKLQGYIISPTYPGVYPDNLFCFYKLQGKPGQRIKLVFQDFSLFYGGEYCPFDYLRIYDGYTDSSSTPIIGTFCGSFNQSTVIFSGGDALFLTFVTGKGRLNFTAPPLGASADFKFARRGFNISYVFSDRFVKLGPNFIREKAEHVLGTECDQRIMSAKESKGTFVSPGYPEPFKEGLVCRYYMDGLMDDQNLEKVKVNFTDFKIPGTMPHCLMGYLGENDDGRLTDGAVSNKYCGSYKPPIFTSDAPRMVITLNTTGAVQGGLFLAHFTFITDYDIDAEQIEEGKCKFHYNNARTTSGTVKSPRHPNSYPQNLVCEYIFRPLPDHYVVISFSVFVMSDSDANPSNPPCETGDYIVFYEEMGSIIKENFTLTEKHCGSDSPGPYVTHRLLKMEFHSDDQASESSVGFKATYKFVRREEVDQICPGRIINGRDFGGTFTSPHFNQKYSSVIRCEFRILASKRDNKILVEIADTIMEGQYGKANCPDVALRMYNDSESVRPMALVCGKKKEEDVILSYISERDSFKILFVASPTSLGTKFFKIFWTELYNAPSSKEHSAMDCPGFRCLRSKYCISPTLKCNGEPNCGKGDDSDETAECSGSSLSSDIFGLISKFSTLFVALFLLQTFTLQA